MVSKFNPGRNIGRVSIRVLPDTKDFNKILRKQLDQKANKLSAAVTIDRAKLDREKIKADIERQIVGIDADGLAAKVAVTIDRAKLKKTALRKSIQEQFDQFENIVVKINAEIANAERFKRDVRNLIREASGNKLNIFANAQTAAAAAQFRYTARDRIVEFFAVANKGALLKTATALAALSGARLAGTWAEDILDFAKNLDKSLPSILNWTTGITSLVAALFAATSGLVGIGAGLFSITPALLVLPGLALNAIGSITALIVAWRNAGTELGSLGDGMRELGDIINTTYWDRARQPILDLVNGLMPQLRNSFRDLSEGVGDFTGALATAFGTELANGRLESIFKGIADGWRVLGTGADGFAGAIVSLSQIAATYTPRLAGWFVRQANTFDSWLKRISEDGRLSSWMEGAIKSMYDLWDATTGIAGVFEGLWKAADQAGSGGLAGFADMMQAWERTVKGADFQRGLSAVFRGSYVAMEAFGDGIRAVGRLVADLDGAFETFIGSSGQFLGGLLEGIANALNSSSVAAGLEGLSAGLTATLQGIIPSLQPIADTFGGFLGTLGTLASSILPTAVGAVAALMPSVESLLGVVDRVVPDLAGAVTSVVDNLAPAVNDFVSAASPALVSIFGTLADALEDAGPKMADLAEGLSPALIAALDGVAAALKPLADLSGMLTEIPQVAGEAMKNGFSWLWDDNALNGVVEEIKKNGGWTGDLFNWAQEFDKGVAAASGGGQQSAQAYWSAFTQGSTDQNFRMPAEILGPGMVEDMEGRGRTGGGGFSRGLAQGIVDGTPDASTAASGIKIGVQNAVSDAGSWLTSHGGQAVGGFKSGADGGVPGVNGVFSGLRGTVQGTFPNPFGMLVSAGSSIMSGLLSGLRSAYTGVQNFIGGIAGWIAANKGPESVDRALLVPAGQWIMGGLERGLNAGFGRVKSRVSTMADEIRGEFGAGLGTGISAGLDKSLSVARSTRLPLAVTGPDGEPVGRGGNTVHVTMPLLPGETPQEQRDNVIKEFQWAL